MKTILNLVLLATALAPFVKGGLEFELPDLPDVAEYSYGTAAEAYKDELRRQTSYNVSEVLLRQINSAGIVCYKIETDVHILDDGGVSINKVSIRASNFDKAAEIVKNSLGKETEVVSYDD